MTLALPIPDPTLDPAKFRDPARTARSIRPATGAFNGAGRMERASGIEPPTFSLGS